MKLFLRFYSILVRLKALTAEQKRYNMLSFYSILVRLKVYTKLDNFNIKTDVSIPYWFD